jgi:hypothetical protein
MKIIPVGASDGLAEFIAFPWTIHRNDPGWIPPLREIMFRDLSGAGAFSRYGRFQLFLCEADGQVAGRIAALVNPRLVGRDGHPLGQLGYFESVDDSAVAAALIDAGLAWLREQGLHEVIGPMNGGAHRLHRFQTRGFDREPYLFEPTNPPYYPRLFQESGFVPIARWYAYELTPDMAAARLAQYDRILTRRPPEGRIEELQTGQSQDTILRVHRLLDRCWEGHVGYSSLDLDEFVEVFAGLLAIMGPGHVSAFVQDEGGDAGFAFVFPDWAREVRALDGHAAGWGRWLGGPPAKRLVLSTNALAPEARRGSAALAQVAWTVRRGVQDGVEDIITAPTVEGYCSTLGDQTREYTLYGRALG